MLRKTLFLALVALLCLGLAAPASAGRSGAAVVAALMAAVALMAVTGLSSWRRLPWSGLLLEPRLRGWRLRGFGILGAVLRLSLSVLRLSVCLSLPGVRLRLYMPPPSYQSQLYLSPPPQREVCYVGGCYHLEGDGISVAYRWVWVPTVPSGPPDAPVR